MQFYDNLIGHELTAQFNSSGHRSKELSEINLHNYILFAGDNVSLGLDKPIEETYPDIIANELNCDYYNVSVFNGGIEATKYNLATWLVTNPHPRAIVICFEFTNALLASDLNYTFLNTADYDDDNVVELDRGANLCGMFAGRNYLANHAIRQLTNVPIYQIVINDKIPAFTEEVIDIHHTGDMFDHTKIATMVVADIRSRTMRIRP